MTEKHLDLVNRRILLKETIPHQEKVFSIFEEHVEWNSKLNVPVFCGNLLNHTNSLLKNRTNSQL